MSNQLENEIKTTLVSLTGINISESPINKNRNAFTFWFDDVSQQESPSFKITAEGLHRHKIEVKMGLATQPLIEQIQKASESQLSLAGDFISLVEKNGFHIKLNILDSSHINLLAPGDQAFIAYKKGIKEHTSNKSIFETSKNAMAPIMTAVAELIGYEETVMFNEKVTTLDSEMEGTVATKTISIRERSRRNRQICLGFHGEVCGICGLDPIALYGDAGSIIEVHHKQPLAILDNPLLFNPKEDLIPLCPNCHRAVHTKRPIPWTPDQIKKKIPQK